MTHKPPTALLIHLQQTFRLDWRGIHGAPHWARVHQNGLRLAELVPADPWVVTLFAYLHDHQRGDDCRDRGHGVRAAEQVGRLNEKLGLGLTPSQQELLQTACAGHSDGTLVADPTVQVCWDADRLDLGRVYRRPHPDRLCTEAARQPDMIEWAVQRSWR
jgi:uncharacterized protein